MSESTPNNSGDNLSDKNRPDKNSDSKFEMISAYIDNEIKSDEQKNEIRDEIEKNPDYYNRYIFEKLAKECIQKRIKSVETPVYLYKNIGKGIDDIINEQKSKEKLSPETDNAFYTRQLQSEKSNLKRYLAFGSIAVIVLIAFSFLLNGYLKKNPELMENDMVSVSRNIFDKVESGQINLKYKSSCAKDLEDSMEKYVNFQVFIPDVKDAELIGGVCNEINGEKLVHFIHKKGNVIIYTLQANYKDIMTNHDKIILCDEFKQNISKGTNWFPCNKDKNNTVVVWFRDNVICASVAHMESDDIYTTLTNFK